MFKNMVNRILEKRKNTIELVEKLNEIYKPYSYGGEKHEDIFCLHLSIPNIGRINADTKEEFIMILNHYYMKTILKGNLNNKTVEELAEIVKNITIKDLYKSMCWYVNKYYVLNNMKYSEKNVTWSKFILILNCIWLLNHEELIDEKIEVEIDKFFRINETFVFNGCKVTTFKNGNIKIVFSDELFKKFEQNFKNALN